MREAEGRWLARGIVLIALCNGVLYALLLPLWEGFDEAFHYAYVQELSVHKRLPSLGHSSLSQEVWQSFLLAPVSHVVQKKFPELRTFDSYYALPEGERRALRKQLENIPPGEQFNVSVGHPTTRLTTRRLPRSVPIAIQDLSALAASPC